VTGVVWSVYPSAPHRLTETQRRADNMTITEASAASIINRLPAETIDKYEQWLREHPASND